MAALTAFQIGVLAVTAISGAASIAEQKKAGRAQERGQDKAQRKADIQSAQARRQQLREARIKRADIQATAANTGAGGSSAEAGAVGSLQSQLGTNLGVSFETESLSRGQARDASSANSAQSSSATFGAIGSFAGSFVDTTSIFKSLSAPPKASKKLFFGSSRNLSTGVTTRTPG